MATAPQITVFTKAATQADSTTLLSKRLYLDSGAVIGDASPCRMAKGEAQTREAATATDLKQIIEGLSGQQRVGLGDHP